MYFRILPSYEYRVIDSDDMESVCVSLAGRGQKQRVALARAVYNRIFA